MGWLEASPTGEEPTIAVAAVVKVTELEVVKEMGATFASASFVTSF